MNHSLVTSNRGGGVASIYDDALFRIRQSAITDTEAAPDYDGEFTGGNGILVLSNGRMELEGTLVHGGINSGVIVADYAHLEAVGSLVTGTRSLLDGSGGHGIINLDSVCALDRCAVRNSGTVGLGSYREPATTSLTQCDISTTRQGGAWLGETEETGEFQVFGDGVLAVDGAHLEVADSTVVSNGRSGIYYSESSGKVSGTLVTGSPSYGLAMDSSAQSVEWEGLDNHIFGNASDLPEAMAADVTETPGGLPVPPPPKVAGAN